MSSELVRFQSGPVTHLVQYVFTSIISAVRNLGTGRTGEPRVGASPVEYEQIGFVLEDAGLPRHIVVGDWSELRWLW